MVLAEIGMEIYFHTTVGDNLDRLTNTIRNASGRSDLIIVCGGLGPTEDDLSREALAASLGIELNMDMQSRAEIEGYFKKRNINMPESNLKQANLPIGGKVLSNAVGTAPGVVLEKDGKLFVLLPGPPSELKNMVENSLLPYLKTHLNAKESNRGAVIHSRILKLCGIGESLAEEKLKDLLKSSNPTIAPTAYPGEVHFRITAKAQKKDEANQMIDEFEVKVRQRIDNYIFGVDGDVLEAAVGRLLAARCLKLAVAESCTGGMLASRITNVPGSSDYFHLGLIVYDNRWKKELLDVPENCLIKYGAVSPEVAGIMANSVRFLAGADIGMGITGIAGPGGATKEKPVGLVYIGLNFQGKQQIREERFSGDRIDIKHRSVQSALTMLWREIKNTTL
jgi:nicotinamide-nucleotide amidase